MVLGIWGNIRASGVCGFVGLWVGICLLAAGEIAWGASRLEARCGWDGVAFTAGFWGMGWWAVCGVSFTGVARSSAPAHLRLGAWMGGITWDLATVYW